MISLEGGALGGICGLLALWFTDVSTALPASDCHMWLALAPIFGAIIGAFLSFIIGALPAGAAIEPIAGAIMVPASAAMPMDPPMSCPIVPVAAMLGAIAEAMVGAMVGAMAEALAMPPDCILSSGLSHAHARRRRAAKPSLEKFMMMRVLD